MARKKVKKPRRSRLQEALEINKRLMDQLSNPPLLTPGWGAGTVNKVDARPSTTKPLDRKALGEHVAALISSERNETHGDPHVQFDCAQALKSIVRAFRSDTDYRSKLGPTEIESIEMLLTKVSRLTCGSNLQDAWLDIAGYALIAAEKAEKPL